MHWLSEPVATLAAEVAAETLKPTAVIIGSGYGGAVAALRLAEAGVKPIVLERGEEYQPGEFPSSLTSLLSHVRAELPGERAPLGYESALFDFRVGNETAVLVGNALGGGSQINANVALQPEPDVLATAWPKAIVDDKLRLQEWFDKARLTLGITELAATEADRRHTKSKAFLRLENDSDYPLTRLEVTPLTVKLPGMQPLPGTVDSGVKMRDCTGCGNCVTGCNEGAKGTLTTSYLPLAKRHGARMFTGVTVLGIAREKPEENSPWTVHCIPTRHRARLRKLEKQVGTTWRAGDKRFIVLANYIFQFSAEHVFVCAGTLGTAELLARSFTEADGTRPRLSATFGNRYSSNGDYLGFSYDERLEDDSKSTVDAVGWHTGAHKGRPIGPTITASLEGRAEITGIKRRFLVQDAAIPGGLAEGIRHMLGLARALSLKRSFHDLIALSESTLESTQFLLCIGHDDSGGKLAIHPTTGRVQIEWPALKSKDGNPGVVATYFDVLDTQLAAATQPGRTKRKTTFLPNPVWNILPKEATSLLSGPSIKGWALAVHPLGGCVMADTHVKGVVDHLGRVFDASNGKESFHAGLYVLDGSIIPRSLGANPFLTICALAERAMDTHVKSIVGKPTKPTPADLVGQPHASSLYPGERATRVTLGEVLRGPLTLRLPSGNVERQAALHIRFTAGNMVDWIAGRDWHFVVTEDTTLRISIDPRSDSDPINRFDPATPPTSFVEYQAMPDKSWVRLFDKRKRRGLYDAVMTWFWLRGKQDTSETVANAVAFLLTREYVRTNVDRLENDLDTNKRDPKNSDLLQVLLPDWAQGISDPLIASFGILPKSLNPKALSEAMDWLKGKLAEIRLSVIALLNARAGREIEYKVEFKQGAASSLPKDWPKQIALTGKKRIEFAAHNGDISKRPSILEMLTALPDVALTNTRTNKEWATGALFMDFSDLVHKTYQGFDAAVNKSGQRESLDTTEGLVKTLAYPLAFVRQLGRAHLLEFRLPDYELPDGILRDKKKQGWNIPQDTARFSHWIKSTHILPCFWDEQEKKWIEPECVELCVPIDPKTPKLKLKLCLWRYPRKPVPKDSGAGTTRFKSILLLHAFAQSAISLAEPTVDGGLAGHLWENGWDVWLLETRMSTALDGATRAWAAHDYVEPARRATNIDVIAEIDIPEAVRHIAGTLVGDSKAQQPVQIHAFGQCIGSAALAMSILSGRLNHKSSGGGEPGPSMLCGAMFSQTTPFLVGQPETQARTILPALLRDTVNLAGINFSTLDCHKEALEKTEGKAIWDCPPGVPDDRPVGGSKPYASTLTDSLIDRLMSGFPIDDKEVHHKERNAARLQERFPSPIVLRTQAEVTWRRLSGIEARLFSQGNLSKKTFDRLPVLIGHASLGIFNHARRCVEYERLVDADGRNVYATQENIVRHLTMPRAFLHGMDNALFSQESSVRSAQSVRSILGEPEDTPPFGDPKGMPTRLILLEGFGHVDCLLGKNAKKGSFPKILKFFADCFVFPAATTSSSATVAAVNASGPALVSGGTP